MDFREIQETQRINRIKKEIKEESYNGAKRLD